MTRREIPLAGERREVVVGEPPKLDVEEPLGEPTPVLLRQTIRKHGTLYSRYTGEAVAEVGTVDLAKDDVLTVHIKADPRP